MPPKYHRNHQNFLQVIAFGGIDRRFVWSYLLLVGRVLVLLDSPSCCLSPGIRSASSSLGNTAIARAVGQGRALQHRCSWTRRRAGTGTHASERISRRRIRADPCCQFRDTGQLHSTAAHSAFSAPRRLDRRQARARRRRSMVIHKFGGCRSRWHAFTPWQCSTTGNGTCTNARYRRRYAKRMRWRWRMLMMMGKMRRWCGSARCVSAEKMRVASWDAALGLGMDVTP